MNGMLRKSVFFSVLAIVIFAMGCSGDSSSSGRSGQAITENDLVNDPTLRVIPEDTVVVFLEPDSDIDQSNDTGERGVDIIPLYFPVSESITFCWEEDDESAGHYAIWSDDQGSEVVRVEANNECVTQTIAPGYHTLHLYHDGQSDETHPIFIRLTPAESREVSPEVAADSASTSNTVPQNKEILIRTNNCVGCDLTGVDLRGAHLKGANLTFADLTNAKLQKVDLENAVLPTAIFTSAHLDGAHMWGANLAETVGLTGDNGATLTGADFSRAIWTDRCICKDESIGKCDPTNCPFTNTIGMTFYPIRPGTFTMGSPPFEESRNSDEKQHQVTLTKVFYIQTTEVTQGQWKEIMGSNHSKFKYGDDWPWDNYTYYSGDKLTWVSWPEVQDFIKKLNEREKTQKYRLPTEAEWEYACRAGTTGWFAFRPYAPSIWYDANSDKRTHRVAKKPANAWGLYDMHGNVREWVQDWYGPYPSVPVTDPKGPTKGTKRVFRGGAFKDGHGNCRSAYRGKDGPDDQGYWEAWPVGFRVAADPVK